MIGRIGSIVSMVAAAALANYAHDAWSSYSKHAGCTRGVTELRVKFEEVRPELRNPAPMDAALRHAAELCANGEYDKARQHLNVTIATCRQTGACVKKRG
jgi:hypothetical protein